MMLKLEIPKGKSLYYDASFDVRRRLDETFKRFKVNLAREVIGESLLRLERVCRKASRQKKAFATDGDLRTQTLFEMFRYYKSLK